MPEPYGTAGPRASVRDRMALGRRGFLALLGLVAGAGALVPLLGRAGRTLGTVRASGAGGAVGAGNARMAGGLVRLEASRPLLGTWVRVVVRDCESGGAARAIEDAFAAIRRVDAQMSIHRVDSQLARVNAAAGRGALTVDPAVLEVVARAVEGARRTGGVYDPTVLPLMRLYGFYDSGRTRLPSESEIARTLELVSTQHVLLDPGARTLGLARQGAALDLGSIGKGWALDRAVDALRAAGVRSGLVDVGGNVYGLGAPDEGAEGWSVGVFHPVAGSLERVFLLRDSAVATSSNTEQTRVLGSLRVGHLFDARHGRPANGHLSASVQAATGVASDELSTIAFLLGPDRFRGWPEALSYHFVG